MIFNLRSVAFWFYEIVPNFDLSFQVNLDRPNGPANLSHASARGMARSCRPSASGWCPECPKWLLRLSVESIHYAKRLPRGALHSSRALAPLPTDREGADAGGSHGASADGPPGQTVRSINPRGIGGSILGSERWRR